MPKIVTYKCPDCSGEFDFMHHPSDEPPPERCELCHAYMGDEPMKAPVLVLKIGTAKHKAPDQLVRRMEDASIVRAEEAAEASGASVSDMSGLKITDLRSTKHEGDVAAVSVTEATKNLTRQVGGGVTVAPMMQNPQAAQWVGETTAGPNALATRNVINEMQTSGRHASTLAAVTRNGSDGKRY